MFRTNTLPVNQNSPMMSFRLDNYEIADFKKNDGLELWTDRNLEDELYVSVSQALEHIPVQLNWQSPYDSFYLQDSF